MTLKEESSHSLVDWLLLDLNSFFASCEQQNNPKLRNKPVAVVPMLTDSTCCLAASYEAKKHGIKTGTSVRDAKQLCPQTIFIVARHKLYVEYHHKILEAVESCWPISKVLSIDEVALELTGSHRQIEKATALCLQLKKALREKVGEYLKCSIGVSTNILLAKVASDMQKPDGLVFIRKEDIPHKLLPLKLRDFPGIGHRMEERLHQHGILSVKELYEKDPKQMRKVWGGVLGENFYQSIRGKQIEISKNSTRSIGHQHVLPPLLRNREKSFSVLKKLLAKAAERMRKEGYRVKQLSVQIKSLHPKYYWENHMRFTSTQNTLTLTKILNQLLKEYPLNHVPHRVGVVLFELIPLQEYQLSFFEEEERGELMQAIDKLNSKYGRNTLYFGGYSSKKDNSSTKIAFQRVPELFEFET